MCCAAGLPNIIQYYLLKYHQQDILKGKDIDCLEQSCKILGIILINFPKYSVKIETPLLVLHGHVSSIRNNLYFS